jgi:hypothetical protein
MSKKTPKAAASEPGLFDSLRTDPAKADAGVWITHPRTRDRFQVKRRGSPEYLRAWFEALEDYEAKHGKDSKLTIEGQRYAESIAMAKSVVIDWKLHNHPDLPYDAVRMAAALADEQLRQDLYVWLIIETDGPTNFRPDAIAGN